MKRKIIVLTDCTDVAWEEIRCAIYQNCDVDEVEIEPVVAVDSYSIENVNFLTRLIAEICPPGTIICVIVNPLKLRTERIVGRTKKKDLIFEGTNTGAFGWLLDDFGCDELYELYDPGFLPFGGKYVHAPAVGKVASGVPLEELGHKFDLAKMRKVDMETGTVMHIDNFGNLKLFHKFEREPKNGDKYLLKLPHQKIVVEYNKRMMERDDGEVIIYPGSSFGFTEIGIVRGNFAKEYNIHNGDKIIIKEEK